MNEIIENAFQDFEVAGIKIPVSFLRHEGKETTYVTYMQTDADNSLSGDNEILAYVDYYDFDIYSKGNYLEVIKSVKRILKEQGFVWQPSRSSEDMYEDDTGYYHKTLCFAIEREEI